MKSTAELNYERLKRRNTPAFRVWLWSIPPSFLFSFILSHSFFLPHNFTSILIFTHNITSKIPFDTLAQFQIHSTAMTKIFFEQISKANVESEQFRSQLMNVFHLSGRLESTSSSSALPLAPSPSTPSPSSLSSSDGGTPNSSFPNSFPEGSDPFADSDDTSGGQHQIGNLALDENADKVFSRRNRKERICDWMRKRTLYFWCPEGKRQRKK